jgi:amidase
MELASALATAAAIRNRQISPVEVLDACLARVDAVNDRVNAIIWRDDDDARSRAKAAADLVMSTDPDGLPPFHGVPIPIKDLTAVEGWPTTYGSAAAPPGNSTESELVVRALERAGFLLAGRTNTPEFGPITVTENVRYGVTRNPWNLNHTPGGSSGGAGAAVAAGMFTIAHANDGGGSIRIPASCCGLVGLKPSRGRVPALFTPWEGGIVEGVVVRTVADAAAVLDVISGPDRLCWYNAPAPLRPFADEPGAEPGHLRIGLVTQPPLDLPIDPECLAAVERTAAALSELGHEIVAADFGFVADSLADFFNVVNSGLADYTDIDWSRTEPHIQANRAAAQQIDSLTYVASVHNLQRFSRELAAKWGEAYDVLLTPTLSILPPIAGEVLAAAHAEPSAPPLQVFQMAAFNATFNISGQPAISLPLHTSSNGLPIGVQLVGGPWQEDLLLRLAAQLETAHPWADRAPDLD